MLKILGPSTVYYLMLLRYNSICTDSENVCQSHC